MDPLNGTAAEPTPAAAKPARGKPTKTETVESLKAELAQAVADQKAAYEVRASAQAAVREADKNVASLKDKLLAAMTK